MGGYADIDIDSHLTVYQPIKDCQMTLAELPVGQRALITHITEKTPMVKRLYELGFLPGEVITVEQRAPFGDPLEVTIFNYQLCLRNSEARCIEVAPS